MFTSNISLVTLVRGVGGKLSRLVYLALRLGFVSSSVISSFLLHHNLGIFSFKRYKHYFRQTEMFTSNVQFGYPCLRGGGQAVQAGLFFFFFFFFLYSVSFILILYQLNMIKISAIKLNNNYQNCKHDIIKFCYKFNSKS